MEIFLLKHTFIGMRMTVHTCSRQNASLGENQTMSGMPVMAQTCWKVVSWNTSIVGLANILEEIPAVHGYNVTASLGTNHHPFRAPFWECKFILEWRRGDFP